jgi:predicted nucleic-acid-binding protein
MPSIDTNILIRYLVRDDESQFRKVIELLKEYQESTLTINIPVIMESCWVLRSTYNYSKNELIETYRLLLKTKGLNIQSNKTVELALDEYEKSNADFEDCLIAVVNEISNQVPTFTFDKKASKLKRMKLLK